MTAEERENYNNCMLVIGFAVGSLARIKEEGKKMAKTTGFPDFHGMAQESLDRIYPIMDQIYKFNNDHEM